MRNLRPARRPMASRRLPSLRSLAPLTLLAIGIGCSGGGAGETAVAPAVLTSLSVALSVSTVHVGEPAAATAALVAKLQPQDVQTIPPDVLLQLSEAAVHGFSLAQEAMWTSAQVEAMTPTFVQRLAPRQVR